MPYPIIELDEDAPTQLEQLGTKTKFWYRDQEGRTILFKEGRPGTGENWAEKVCCEICRLLDLPHAEYDLAVWKDRKGVISTSFVPRGGRLVLGNELLAKVFGDYDQSKRFQARQHTVRTLMKVAASPVVGRPLKWLAPAEIKDAADVVVGYLALDTLVGNQDRHHENWGVILVPDEGVFLAPSFDHASSLGRNETDQARAERLKTRDKGRSVEAYVERARSAFFATPSSPRPLKTLEAFREVARIRPAASDYWLKKLAEIDLENYRKILMKIPNPEISAPARDFAYRMLEINTGRILQSIVIQ